ncbi:hypothetical protein HY750_03880 [Candidatus Kuenenbacteria bacterium]|nr:hypothetical protein [Candidatus Kuenenbacteria bacterium]
MLEKIEEQFSGKEKPKVIEGPKKLRKLSEEDSEEFFDKDKFLKKLEECNPEIVYKEKQGMILCTYLKDMVENDLHGNESKPIYDSLIIENLSNLTENEKDEKKEELKKRLYEKTWEYLNMMKYYEKILKNIFKVDIHS